MALAAPTPSKMTASEFFALPGELPHAQLINGELIVNSPAARHQRIILWLSYLFFKHAEDHPGLGEMGMEIDTPLNDLNVYKPDLWWVPEAQRLASDDNRFSTPPPLVVEVRSPSTWRYDVGTKLRTYDEGGVSEVWLVDTAADVVLVYRRSSPNAEHFDVELELTASDVLDTPLIPGWEIDLAGVFAR
ncbi:MAG: Uma2 family endonuclease [Acidimicrobiales bacterium]|nr:Uma2 family endonuclease [Acidimicrobiales bacterium]